MVLSSKAWTWIMMILFWMTILTDHCLATIYTEAHALAFATHPMYTERRTRIAGKFGEEFLQLGKPLINQQAKIALACLQMAMMTIIRKCLVSSPLTLQGPSTTIQMKRCFATSRIQWWNRQSCGCCPRTLTTVQSNTCCLQYTAM